MKTAFLDTPRRFSPDGGGKITISDLGSIELAADEQFTLRAPTGSEYDVARKAWGYYATPSLNGRLPAKGLRPALVRNAAGRFYVMLVENSTDAEASFAAYLATGGMHVVGWLDQDATLARIEAALEGS
jgi:hypothetical protein